MSPGSAYEALHQSIVSGQLSPGERLVEEELADQLGLGRAAVRTALIRLEHDGLVERERNRGARVRRVSEQEAVQILEARAVLEGLAAGHAAEHATDIDVADLRAILGEMRALLDDGDLLGASERNAVLHRRILEISGHAVAQRICANLHSQIVRFQFRTILAPGRAGQSYAEHEAVVDAIAAHDRDAAEVAMKAHLSHVSEALHAIAAAAVTERA
jgi:DNA-binding GntR family transcriptional regulator